MRKFFDWSGFDWVLFLSTIPLLGAGLITMRPFVGEGGGYFFERQIIWIIIGLAVFFIFSRIDWNFLKTSGFLFLFFVFSIIFLAALLFLGKFVRGASSWFDFYFFSVEPAEPAKFLLILILAKYFSRRHIAIANFKHIFISGIYAAAPALLTLFQPDFGSAAVFVLLWLGMVASSGISKKHLLLVLVIFCVLFGSCWAFVLEPYQKSRILTFLNLQQDPQGAGYNALQSIIAVGSGRIWGKGIGYGTQSRLNFLPEYRTDFIFAAFAEEWGFVGVLIIFVPFGVLIWRILRNAFLGQFNFERLFGVGLSLFLMIHFFLHIGMNTGILPVTGLSMPFLSYGGSHLVTIFAGLGILVGFRGRAQAVLRENTLVEFLGA